MAANHPPITSDVERAGRAIAEGRLVGIPTETVYGLAADAADPAAVRAIFAAKGRPLTSPLIVHIADASQVEQWARDIPPWAWALMQACWPGPLTVVLRAQPTVPQVIIAGGDTVALRMPDHALARAVIAASGTAVAAPSANRHGAVSPTRPEHVAAAFDAATVACVLDGGPSTVGIESTIVDCSADAPVILRTGAFTAQDVTRITGLDVDERIEHLDVERLADAHTPAPGQARSHYAPRARVDLQATSAAAFERHIELSSTGERCMLLLGDCEREDVPVDARADVLLATRDAARFAHGLYAALHSADEAGAATIVAVPPPRAAGDLSAATLDRLQRAAAPRPGEA